MLVLWVTFCSPTAVPRTYPSVAIIGGGISGLICAGRLRQLGVTQTTVFDTGKSSAPHRYLTFPVPHLLKKLERLFGDDEEGHLHCGIVLMYVWVTECIQFGGRTCYADLTRGMPLPRVTFSAQIPAMGIFFTKITRNWHLRAKLSPVFGKFLLTREHLG